VADRDHPAVDVRLGQIGAGVVGPDEHDRGERLVDLEQVDVASVSPARCNTFCVAGITPVSMSSRSEPTKLAGGAAGVAALVSSTNACWGRRSTEHLLERGRLGRWRWVLDTRQL
jgi:hypothetical protein